MAENLKVFSHLWWYIFYQKRPFRFGLCELWIMIKPLAEMKLYFLVLNTATVLKLEQGGWVRVNVAIFRKQPKYFFNRDFYLILKKARIIFKGFLLACFDRIKRKMLCWPEEAPSKQISQKFIADY